MTEKNFFSDKKKQFATLLAFLAGVIAVLIVMWVIFTDLPNITPIFCFIFFSDSSYGYLLDFSIYSN